MSEHALRSPLFLVSLCKTGTTASQIVKPSPVHLIQDVNRSLDDKVSSNPQRQRQADEYQENSHPGIIIEVVMGMNARPKLAFTDYLKVVHAR